MKIKFLLFALLISALGANAQYSIVDGDGNDINDGDLIIRNSTAEDDALKFFVTYDSGATLRSTIEYVSSDVGGSFQICYGGQCYDAIAVGGSYPPVSAPQIIEPSATTGQGNKIFYNEVDNPQISNHVLRFYIVDESGADIGGDLTFTYQYDPTMGLEDIASQLGITLDATVVTNTIALTSRENASMQIFDINGRLMQTNDVSVGAQNIDVSGLSSQLYIVSFEVANGNKQSIKVLKK
jgi:hypothetical protein